jgi:adenylate kinase family enzyme
MKRVLVIGSGGAGKSTFARRLGERLGLPVIHLDRLYWRPGWVETPEDEWRRKVEELCAGESWVMDGNYSGTLDVRLAACDTVVFLDLPRTLCLWRVLKRAIIYWGASRPDVAEGCHENLNMEFFLWVWNYPRRSRPKVLSRLEEYGRDKQIVILLSSAEVEKFLEETR